MSDSIDTAKERAVLNDFNLLMDMADRKPAFTLSGAMPEIVTITHRFSAALVEIDRLREELSILLHRYEMGGGYSDQYSRQARAALNGDDKP